MLEDARRGIVVRMKTASVQQLPEQWPQILRWVAAGEEVQVKQQDKVVAKVVPATDAPQPDFLARAKMIWGEQPPGKPLSAVIAEARKRVVETVCGKYSEQMRPGAAFMHDKTEEKRLEERRWQS